MDGRSVIESTLSTTIRPGFFAGTLDLFVEYLPFYLQGLLYTLLLAVVGTTVGLLIAFVFVVLKIQTVKRVTPFIPKNLKHLGKAFVNTYVTIFRGTPMMVQAMIFYYGLASLGVRLPILAAGLIVVTLNTAAYLTEILRSGLESIDPGQREAAESLGMTTRQTYQKILLVQAFKNMIPAIGNELIVNIKDTAVLSVIGVGELFYMGRSVAGAHYRYTESFMIVAIIYLIVVMIAVYLLKQLSRWMGKTPKDLNTSESGQAA